MPKRLLLFLALTPAIAFSQLKVQSSAIIDLGQTIGPMSTQVNLRDFYPPITTRVVERLRKPENPPMPAYMNVEVEPNTLPLGQVLPFTRVQPSAYFPAIDFTGWRPADPSIAVGPNHIMVVVNSRFAVFNKSTGVKMLQQDFDAFHGIQSISPFVFDPKIVYDRIANRWVMIILFTNHDQNASRIYFAVSATSDPTGTWHRYDIDSMRNIDQENTWLDYPGLGYNKDAYVIAGNQFTFIGSSFKGSQYLVIRKSSVLNGGSIVLNKFLDQDSYAIQVAEMFSPTADRVYGVGRYFTNNQFKVVAFTNLATTPAVTGTKLTVPTYTVPTQGAPTPSTSPEIGRFLDTIDARTINAAWRDGKLLTSHTLKGVSGRHVVRWYEINTNNYPSALPTIGQQGDVAGDDHFHMGAVTKNAAGDIALVMTRSNETNRVADIMAAGRRSSDPFGSVGTPTLLQASGGAHYGWNGTNRWGDYSMVAVDPSDDTSFWVVAMRGDVNEDWTTSFFRFLVTVPVSAANLSLSANQVNGGTPVTGTVTLSAPASGAGVSVSLDSNSTAVTVPATVHVAAGASAKTFSVATLGVDTTVSATVTASAGGQTRTANLTVLQGALSTLSLASSSVGGGSPVTATVGLTAKAGPSGRTVSVTSNKAEAQVPATATIAAQANTGTFTITTTNPAADVVATISVSSNGITRTQNLTVKKTPALTALRVSPTSVPGGSTSKGTVFLATQAPANVVIALSDNTSIISVPPTVQVNSGNQSGTFTINTSSFNSTATRQVFATLNGVTKSANLTVTPGSSGLSALSLNPATVKGGTSTTGTVTLSGAAPAGGAVVSLADNSSAIATPPSVSVAPGALSASFTVTTSPVTATATRQVTATLNGVSKTASVTLTP